MRKALLAIVAVLLIVAVVVALYAWPTSPPLLVPEDTGADAGAAEPDFAQVPVEAPAGGLTLTGTVNDAAGRPVAQAEVFLVASAQQTLVSARCEFCEAPLLSCPAQETAVRVASLARAGRGLLAGALSTRTDAGGAFRFERLVGVSFTVWAKAKDLGVAVRERAAPGEPVVLFLPALRSIAGTLHDERGAPIAQGTVRAIPRRVPLPFEATSGPDGRFDLGGLGEGPFYVVVEAPGYLPRALLQVEAGPAAVHLVLSRSRRLEVRVLSRGQPVAAQVRVSADHLAREAIAAAGVATFEGLYPDDVLVTATYQALGATPRTARLDSDLTQLTLELDEAGTLLVGVVDEAGQAVRDSELELRASSGELVARRKGRGGEPVQFGPLGEGAYTLHGSAPGFRAAELPVELKVGQAAVELVLTRGIFITGKVLDEYGRAAQGVSVLVSPMGDSVIAGPDGRFTAQVPSPGLYELHAHHSDWGGGSAKVNAPAEGVVLQLEPKAGVAVTVTAEGRRVEGAQVVLFVERESSFRSDRPSGADGVVLMRGLPPGTYWLVAAHPRYLASDRQRVSIADGQLLQIGAELRVGARIVGDVIDTQGVPVPGVSVVAFPRGAEPSATDAQGRFELGPLRPQGAFRLEARHPSYEQKERVQAVAGGEPVRITLVRREVFSARVLGDDGKPLRRFRVDDREVDSPDGRFQLPLPSAEGRVIFLVEATGFEPLMVDRPEAPDLGDLVLNRAPEFTGVVRDESGTAVQDAVVSCDVCSASVLSGPDGKFRLPRPPYVPNYVVTARKGSLAGSRPVSGAVGGPVEVTLASAVELYGKVYLPDGRPGAGVEIEGMNVERSEPVTIVTAQDGSYTVRVPAGAYRFAYGELGAPTGQGVDSAAIIARIEGARAKLDFGPVPGTVALTVRVQPERGAALWVLRGEVSGANMPVELLRASYAQLVYEPTRELVRLAGLAPGRYTLVWGTFHIEPPGGPVVRSVDLPAAGEVSLLR